MFGVNPGQPFDGLGRNRFWSQLWSIFLMAVVATTGGINTCRCFLLWVVNVFGVNPGQCFDVVGGGRFWSQPRSTIRCWRWGFLLVLLLVVRTHFWSQPRSMLDFFAWCALLPPISATYFYPMATTMDPPQVSLSDGRGGKHFWNQHLSIFFVWMVGLV